MTLAAALQNLFIFSVPAIVYVVVQRARRKAGWAELAHRVGLRTGDARSWAYAALASIPFGALTVLIAHLTLREVGEYSTLKDFAGQPVSADLLWRAFLYAGIATGLAEEVFFRGLIAGALFRRLRFWTANGIQAGIFTALHALLLLVAPRLWPLLLVILALALVLGWLRHRSGSIGPPWLVHASGNFIGAVAVMNGFAAAP